MTRVVCELCSVYHVCDDIRGNKRYRREDKHTIIIPNTLANNTHLIGRDGRVFTSTFDAETTRQILGFVFLANPKIGHWNKTAAATLFALPVSRSSVCAYRLAFI